MTPGGTATIPEPVYTTAYALALAYDCLVALRAGMVYPEELALIKRTLEQME